MLFRSPYLSKPSFIVDFNMSFSVVHLFVVVVVVFVFFFFNLLFFIFLLMATFFFKPWCVLMYFRTVVSPRKGSSAGLGSIIQTY